MASCQTTRWGTSSPATSPYVKLTVTESASTATTSTLSYTLQYISDYAASTNGVGREYTIKIAGATVKTGTYNINGVTGTKTIASGTKVINKTTAAQSVSFSVSFAFNISWNDIRKNTLSASSTISVAAKTSYTVSYNANGGSGAPSAQTKYYGTALTLSGTKPTRTGYTFQGWATSASGGVAYSAGGSYTANAAVTLYAVWSIITYAVKYNANGGSNAPAAQTKKYGTNLTLSSSKPTRTGYNFKGWGTSASATTVSYAAGASYTANAAITLYAIWEVAYVKPRIFNLSVDRCNSSGTATEDGTNALVKFSWSTDKTVSSITVKWKLPTATSWSSKTVTASGTSGTVSTVAGSNGILTDNSYDIRVEVADSGGSSYAETTLSSMKFTTDLKAGGDGFAVGKAAELGAAESLGGEGVAEFAFDAKFNEPVYGKALGMDKLPSIPSNANFNNYIEPGCYAVHGNTAAATISNIPIDRAGRLEVWSATGEGVRSQQWSYIRQRYIPYNSSNAVWERDITRGEDNVWHYYDWWKSSLTPDASNYVYGTATQRVLWGANRDAGYFMTSVHIIDLPEPVSAQRNGIVLVFCPYYSATDTNYAYQSFFVPKQLVSLLSSKTHSFFLNRVTFGAVAGKQLTITDTQIIGNDYNDDTGTANGITYANNKFVLRYIIGV